MRNPNYEWKEDFNSSARLPTHTTYCRIISITGIEGHQFTTLVMAIVSRIQMPLAMEFMVALDTKSCQILCRGIADAVPWLNVMELKILCTPAELALPAVRAKASLQR